MRSFLQKSRGDGPYREHSRGVRFLETPCYQEFENPLDDGSFGVLYVVPRASNSYTVCACIPDDIAVIANAYTALDPHSQRAVQASYHEMWPLLTTLRSNGIDGQYLPAALVIVEDPDYGIERWALVTVVGNVTVMSASDMLNNARMVEALSRVSDSCEAVIRGVTITPATEHRLANARRLDGITKLARSVTDFVDDNLDPLVDLVKVLAGDGQRGS